MFAILAHFQTPTIDNRLSVVHSLTPDIHTQPTRDNHYLHGCEG
jgi:hypothetical protein